MCEDSLDRSCSLDLRAVDALGVDYDSAFSLRSQILGRRVRKTSGRVRSDVENAYAARWLEGAEGSDVLSLARDAR